jgi:acetoin:2,6-dichlorophenolindophenol oxidoreductase subunit beta
MSEVTYRDATLQAILEEMRADPRVFVMGEDLHTGMYAPALAEFGPQRIRSTPICEGGFIGAGIGAALTGMRPVIEATVATFLYSAMDQIANQAAKSRYMFGGQASVPIVIRATTFYGAASAAHHSDRPWGLFAQIPGLKIVVPATPQDARGLMKAAIRDSNPVLWFDDFTLLGSRGAVAEHDDIAPLGVADVKREGTDATIVTVAAGLRHSLAAAQLLEREGVQTEIVDVRTIVPLDRRAIVSSIAKTGRLVVVDPAPRTCGLSAEIAAIAAEHAFGHLRAPVIRLAAPDVPVPFCPELEQLLYPQAEGIAAAVRRLVHG